MANSKTTGKGRGWHGDPAGHAAAGSQSHKNDTKRRSRAKSSGGNR